MPLWALTLTYWLHLLATVLWIGSLASLTLLVLPAARRTLEPAAQAALLDGLQPRLESLGWFCLGLLLATGMFQLSANANYTGLFSTANQWSQAILVKHLLFVVMIFVSAAQAWWVLPALRRAILRARRGGGEQEIAALRRREAWLLRLNFLLAMLVLAATALARAS
jgi:uncharacterized membrane protein